MGATAEHTKNRSIHHIRRVIDVASIGLDDPLERRIRQLTVLQTIDKFKSTMNSLNPLGAHAEADEYQDMIRRNKRQDKIDLFKTALRRRNRAEKDFKYTLREDSMIWSDIPREDQFSYRMETLSSITDKVMPMVNELTKKDTQFPDVLGEKHLDMIVRYGDIARSVFEDEFEESENERQYAKAYWQYFQYYLWKSGRVDDLPRLSDIQFTTSLADRLPSCVIDFHARVLPQLHIRRLQLAEDNGEEVHSDVWYEVFREQTRRLLIGQISEALSDEDVAADSGHEITQWRKEYLRVAKRLDMDIVDGKGPKGEKVARLRMPTLKQVKKDLYLRLEEMMSDRDAKTLVVGVSGDLDSCAMVSLLAEVIRERKLPFTIKAFTLKKDHHNSRFKRIEEMMAYANRDSEKQIVDLDVYEMAYAFYALMDAIYNRTSTFPEPTVESAKKAIYTIVQVAKKAIDTLTRVGTDAQKRRKRDSFGLDEERVGIADVAEFLKTTYSVDHLKILAQACESMMQKDATAVIPPQDVMHLIAHLLDQYGDRLSLVENAFDAREQSNLIHEFLISIRGYICRHTKWPMAISGQNLTEIAFDNFTSADTFVGWMPLAPYPKTVIAHAFRELLDESEGMLKKETWEVRPLSFLVPWYPDRLKLEEKSGKRTLRRLPWFIQEFTSCPIDLKTSGIPREVWEGMQQVDKRYLLVDGNVQWHLDPYLHEFMQHGLSDQTVRDLIEEYPKRKTDILFAAMLMANGFEKRQKSIFVHQAARHNLQFLL